MADPDVTIKGILGVNDTAPPNENTGYYLDHVAIEVDMSDVKGLDRSLEGLPLSVEGHFEVREDDNPDSPIRWILRHTAFIRTWAVAAGVCRAHRPRTGDEGSVQSALNQGAKLATRSTKEESSMSEERPQHTQEPAEGADEDVEAKGAEKAGETDKGTKEPSPSRHTEEPAEGSDQNVDEAGSERAG